MLAVFSTLISRDAVAQEDTFIIDNTQVALNYLIDGVPDPDLVLVRGKTYVFQLSTPGHPFCIKTEPTLGEVDDRFDFGVTNNCIESGTLTFVVPLDAPDLLYYICSVHISMTAQILIVDALPEPPAQVSATDGTYLDKVRLIWSDVSDETSYQVFRCSTSSTGSCGSAIATPGADTTSYDDFNASSNGTVHHYRVTACNFGGCSDFSAANTGYRQVSVDGSLIFSDGFEF